MKLAPVIDLRSPAQVDRYWLLQWRLRTAANPRIKAANIALAEWHARNDVKPVKVKAKVLPMLLRRQA